MKRYFFLLMILLFAARAIAQNTFPSSGNVGINTGSSAITNKLQIGPNPQGWSANDLVISNGNGGVAVYTTSDHTYFLGDKSIALRPGLGTMAVFAHSSGNVGIRSINPQGHLQVSDYRPVIIKNNGGSGVYGSEIGFNAVLNTTVVPNTLKKLGGTGQKGGASVAVNYEGNMLFQMYNAGNESESTVQYNPQVVFANTGNIGMGTTAPKTNLEIRTSGTGGKGDGSLPTNGILLGCKNSGTALNIGVYATGPQYSWIQSRSQNDATMMNLLINPWGGNVAIGTVNPDARLTVKGSIHAEEVKVDLNVPPPDYVFEPGYNLLPLSDLGEYVGENKHLPGIPSGDEMQKNGILLMEMNMLLLKKVEELTLYMIQMDQENQILKSKVELLENRIIDKRH